MAKEPERSVEATLIPLTVADVREQCHINHTAEDALIERSIQTARTIFEDTLNLTFLTTTWKMYWDQFETPLVVPRPPYASTTTLTYLDTDAVTITLTLNTHFVVDSHSTFALIKPEASVGWPSDVEGDGYNPIILTYVAGYTTVAKVPKPWIQSLLLLTEVIVNRYGPYESAAGERFEMPWNNISALIGAYAIPNI